MTPLLLALSFLTRYPVPRDLEPGPGDFGRATGYFPLAGFLAGLDLLFLRWLFSLDPVGMHYPLWCMLLLAYWCWSCASLHLDGLADTCDALASRARGGGFLTVLHDSRIGAFGAMAIGLALMARFAWLYTLPNSIIWFLPLPLVTSRLLGALLCHGRPYAGASKSLSALFFTEARGTDQSLALSWAFAAFLGLGGLSAMLGFADARALGLALAACGLSLLVGYTAVSIPRRRLGGLSGDLVGFAMEFTEVSTAFLLAFFLIQ